VIRLKAELDAGRWDSATSLRRVGTKRTDARRLFLYERCDNSAPHIGGSEFLCEQRKVAAATAHRNCVEPVGQKNGAPSRIRHVQRLAGCAGISRGPKCAVQSNIQHPEFRRFEFSDRSLGAGTGNGKISARRSPAGPEDADANFVFVAGGKRAFLQTSLTIGYIGSHGYHELIGIDANEPFPVICPAAPCPANYPATFPAGLADTPVPAGTFFVPTNVRANPAFGKHLDVVFARRQFVSRVAGGFESPVQ